MSAKSHIIIDMMQETPRKGGQEMNQTHAGMLYPSYHSLVHTPQMRSHDEFSSSSLT